MRSEGFSVDISGDLDFVERSWESLRGEMIERARASAASARSGAAGAMPAGQGYLWIAVLHDLYKTVYVQRRAVMERSALARCVDLNRVARVYVHRQERSHLEELFPFGRTVWSELTESGQTTIGGND